MTGTPRCRGVELRLLRKGLFGNQSNEGNEAHWCGGISSINQHFPNFFSIIFYPLNPPFPEQARKEIGNRDQELSTVTVHGLLLSSIQVFIYLFFSS
jgi:hypothetical protein